MFLKTIIFIFTILSLQFTAQKRKTDTVFLYEKVIVYDTVYLEKAVKSRFNDVQISLPTVKDQPVENRIFKARKTTTTKKTFLQSFQYGMEGGVGFKNTTWARELNNDKQQFGENLGIWVSKSVSQNLYLLLSANVYRWNSTFDLDANKEETYLDGFYFTQDSQPLLFQRFNNKHFEYTAQLKVLYEWKKFRPFVGFAVNRNSYKMQFLVPENQVLNKLDDFKSKNFNLGFSFGLQYQILPKIMISADYQQFSLNNLSLKNSSFDFDIFKTNNTFAERKLNFGISYSISR
ncbi:outer membrane beta-barrel protein [Chryseobacterium sp. PBS4-4]|uniref:Outer membrane beta-barrel protein n=1 Tax=Chryseobacterium edaphi TaxID=2976532 RepID=A0ABT2W4G3_9FLAO|nr:outer membrane beta-barrel protein [Chryseobacterium edaphi]MCU7615620.1 outer membrane beta-barrel protein [Chryseobacterium edaphi]